MVKQKVLSRKTKLGFCDCCNKKKATIYAKNGQHCCKQCVSTVDICTNILGDILRVRE